MKNILFIALIFFSCKNNKEVENENLKKELIDLPVQIKIIDENNLVGFACYYSGRRSEPVEKITEILERKNYNELKKKISSEKPAEKYLATFACIKLLKNEIIELDQNELNQIEENKKSDLKIDFCGGCTNNENYKISELFSEKIEFTTAVENWFNQIK